MSSPPQLPLFHQHMQSYIVALKLDSCTLFKNKTQYVIQLHTDNNNNNNNENYQNTFDINMIYDLHRSISHCVVDATSMIITSKTAKFFSNGHNLNYLTNISDEEANYFIKLFYTLMAQLLTLPFPTIAIVNGHAFAGGLLLALCCDYRVMRKDRGYLCMNEIDMVPSDNDDAPLPGSYENADTKLMSIIKLKVSNPTILKRIILQGERFDGSSALGVELVDYTDTMDRIFQIALHIVNNESARASNTMKVLKKELVGVEVMNLLTDGIDNNIFSKEKQQYTIIKRRKVSSGNIINDNKVFGGKNNNLPPGPDRKDLKDIGNLNSIFTFRDLHIKYGRTFLLPLGKTPLVVTSDPTFIQTILGKDGTKKFPRPPHQLKQIQGLFGRAQIGLDDEDHENNKRMLSDFFFAHETNEKLNDKFKKISNKFVDLLITECKSNSGTGTWEKPKELIKQNRMNDKAKENVGPVEAFRYSELLSTDLNGVISFGSSYNALEKKTSKELEALKAADFIFLSRAMNKNYEKTESIEIQQLFNQSKSILGNKFQSEIDFLEKMEGENNSGINPSINNALQHMLQSNIKNRSGNCPFGNVPTLDEAKFNMVGFLAGVGNSARLISICIEMLAQHPNIQDEILKELKFVVMRGKLNKGNEHDGVSIADLTFNDIEQLGYLDCFVNECLRMYPPSVSVAPRVVVDESVKLGKYEIPQNSTVMCNVYSSHRDPNTWGKDANIFNPLRFGEIQTNGLVKPRVFVPEGFFPFGYGGHGCIGKNLAKQATKIVLAQLVGKSFVKPARGRLPVVFDTTNSAQLLGFLEALDGVWVEVVERNIIVNDNSTSSGIIVKSDSGTENKMIDKTCCLVKINNKIYDVTTFLSTHPGGEQILQKFNLMKDDTIDATKTFNAVGHSTFALKEMERYYIQQHDGLKKMESGL